MKLFIRKICLIALFIVSTYFCYSQKERVLSAGVSAGYGFGKEINNFATTIKLNYYPFQDIRVAPSFSFYLNKNNTSINIFSFNFNYLFPDLISGFFPVMQNKNMTLYPVVGFCIANIGSKRGCLTCSESSSFTSFYSYRFGFDFGVGIDYDLSVLFPIFRDMDANFEMQYQLLESYVRIQLMVGLVYNF
jgi:hypothetical protein